MDDTPQDDDFVADMIENNVIVQEWIHAILTALENDMTAEAAEIILEVYSLGPSAVADLVVSLTASHAAMIESYCTVTGLDPEHFRQMVANSTAMMRVHAEKLRSERE